MTVLRVPALYMRGGTSKGVFFRAEELPVDKEERDRILLRVIGSPDRFGTHIDGMGGATSSTSKVVLLSRSSQPSCHVDYLFGQVAIDRPVIDWTGNCGNLSAALGPAAIHLAILPMPADGMATVEIWQSCTRMLPSLACSMLCTSTSRYVVPAAHARGLAAWRPRAVGPGRPRLQSSKRRPAICSTRRLARTALQRSGKQ